MPYTPELTRAIQLHLTSLLSDRTATRFIESYGSTRSRKGRNILVTNLVAAYETECAYPDVDVKRFTAILDVLLSRFNRPVDAASSIVVEVRRSSTHNPLDWLCVGDSKHWSSCLSTGYHKVFKSSTPSAESYAKYADLDYLSRNGLYHADFNSHYAVHEYHGRDNIILLTTGNPVYVDGEGYTSRVRLHIGLVTVTSPGATAVNKDCLIWDRFYGNGQYLVPTWEKAIELSQQLGLLLVTRRRQAAKHNETTYRAVKEDKKTYSDYFDDTDSPVVVRLIHSTHDIEDRERRVGMLKAVMMNRQSNETVRMFAQVDPHTLTYTYNRYAMVTRKVKQAQAKQIWVFDKEVSPDQVVLTTPLTRSKVSSAIIKLVISEYGYPVKCVTTNSSKYYVFNSKHDSYRFLECYTTYIMDAYLRTVSSGMSDIYANTSAVKFNDGRTVVHYLDVYGNVNTATWYDESTYCSIHSRYDSIRDVIGKIKTMDEVPYPKHIPGTHIRNISNKRPPHIQREYLMDMFTRLTLDNDLNLCDSKFMKQTIPFLMDMVYGKQ